jgi:hypothetical protein
MYGMTEMIDLQDWRAKTECGIGAPRLRCQYAEKQSRRMKMSERKIRIAVLHFSHETVSFLPNETTLDDFIYPGSPAKGEALLQFDPKNYMGGTCK